MLEALICAIIIVGAVLCAIFIRKAPQEPCQQKPTQKQGVSLVEENSTVLEDSGSFGMLLVAEGANGFMYYRDSVTDVLYLWKDDFNSGGLTTMQDPESGLPLTYARYMALNEEKSRYDFASK